MSPIRKDVRSAEPARPTTPGPEDRRGAAAGAAYWAADFSQRIYPAHKLAAVVNASVQAGVEATALLSGSGLTERQLRSAATRISYAQMVAVFRNALRLSPDPLFALRAGQTMRVTSYGMYGYALMSSPSHAVALDFAAKYHRVMGPVAHMSVCAGEEEVVFIYLPVLSHDPTDALYRACVEFVFASQLTLERDLYGPSFHFTRICTAAPAPPHARLSSEFFGCAVEYGQPRNEVAFSAHWVAQPISLSDPIANSLAHEMCEQVFAQLENTEGIASRVRRSLLEHPGRFPTVEAMAESMSMSSRMLHRRLAAEQTTYRQLLGDVRMRLAVEYLSKTSMTNEEIAARLGYSDAANFRHAFMRRLGRRPSDYRP
ncbi:MAG: AraC family transcriptional regulator [Acidovorax sp.]